MVRNLFDLNPPIEQVRSAVERPEIRLTISEKKDLTHQQKMKKLVSTTVNKKHRDGRIHSTGEDGKYSSHSVSPYSKVFLDNIEDEMKDLLMVLVKKGYLPISSCASHGLTDRRYFTLCFDSLELAESFVIRVSRVTVDLTVAMLKAENFLNTRVDINDKGTIKSATRTEIDKNLVNDYLNAMFMGNSRDWWVVTIEIMEDLNPVTDWGMVKRWFYKKFKLKKDTKILMDHIRRITL